MSITPRTDTMPACYGVLCPKHAACARYHAVEQTSMNHTQATCDDGQGGRPMFVEQKKEEAA